MEQKIDATEYLMTVIAEMEKGFGDLQEKINMVASEKSWASAAAEYRHLHGMLTGIYWVVNAMEECETGTVLQDVLEKMEDRIKDREELLTAMKSGYWGKAVEE